MIQADVKKVKFLTSKPHQAHVDKRNEILSRSILQDSKSKELEQLYMKLKHLPKSTRDSLKIELKVRSSTIMVGKYVPQATKKSHVGYFWFRILNHLINDNNYLYFFMLKINLEGI